MAKVEPDLQKRNTDCVYFLASPLTCKKGMHCEYRHSDVARRNPQDCWYWLSGSCFNPTCAFRHPPLDNEHQSNTAPSASAPPPSAAKTNAPCYYYFNGFCNKGDRCSFSHIPERNKFSWKLSKTVSDFSPPTDPKTVVSSADMEKPLSVQIYTTNPIPTVKPKIEDVVIPESLIRAESSGIGRPEERREPSPGFDVLVADRPADSVYANDLGPASEDGHFLCHPHPDFVDGCSRSPKRPMGVNGSFGMDLRDHLKKRRESVPTQPSTGLGRHLTSEVMRNGKPISHESEQYWGRPNFVASVVSVEKEETASFYRPKTLEEIQEERRLTSSVAFFQGPKPLSEILKDRKKEGGQRNGYCSSR